MINKEETILLGHGSGGKLSQELITGLFVQHFDNDVLRKQGDSALLNFNGGQVAFTTDSFVVDPVFFPGGDIGKLAVCGTVNDLAVAGATPRYLSASFIIEEGLAYKELEKIVESMAAEAKKAGVDIVTGDTKVVGKGMCDKVFINTAGIGAVKENNKEVGTGKNICCGDKIIINGSIGDHGMAVMGARSFENFTTGIQSDCASLNHLIREAIGTGEGIRFMRDATRGGLSTVLAEMVEGKGYGIEIDEEKVPVKENVRGMCELLGLDPFYVANEGKVVMVADESVAGEVLGRMRKHPLGSEAQIIGEVVAAHPGRGVIKTVIGGTRIIDMLAGEQLPRIC